jgi:hypothetical protein
LTPDGAGFARAAFSPAGPSHRLRTTTSIASASRALVTSVALMLHGISATTHFAGEGQGLPRWPHRRRSKMFHVSHVTSSQTCFSWARTQRMAWSRSRTQGDLRHIIRCKTANGGNKRRGSGVAGGMCERKLRVVWPQRALAVGLVIVAGCGRAPASTAPVEDASARAFASTDGMLEALGRSSQRYATTNEEPAPSDDRSVLAALQTEDWAKLRTIAGDLVVDDSVRYVARNLRALPPRRHLRNEDAGGLLVSVYEYGPAHELQLGYRRDDGKLRLVAVSSFGW